MTSGPCGRFVIRFDGGPWHGTTWTPANPAGVLSVLRLTGWSGSYRRYRLDTAGRWVYRWDTDFVVPT